MLRVLRITVALAFFAAINLFFLSFADAFGVLAKVQLVPALLAGNFAVVAVILGVTAVCGRIYCSTVCPLGVFQDIVLGLRRRVSRPAFVHHPSRPLLRLGFALAFAALVLVGCTSLAGAIDPYSLYGRFATHLFEPVAAALVNAVAAVTERLGCHVIMKQTLVLRGVAAFVFAAVAFVALVAVAAGRGRLFCNTVCPVGTLLAAVSFRPVLKVRLDAAKCVKCGLCARACKAECIDVKAGEIDQSRCVRCFDCLATCKKGAIKWR